MIGGVSAYTSPVPTPGPGVAAPEVYREIYPMPMFLTVPTRDLAASKDFWIRGLGFVDLFSVPDGVTHLRRWAFQDVLLVPGDRPEDAPAASVSFACVLGQIGEIAARCEDLAPGCTTGPREMPWNSMELTVITPENARVVMTAARPLDLDGRQAGWMRSVGIEVPEV